MTREEAQNLIRQELQTFLMGMMKPEDKASSGLLSTHDMALASMMDRLTELEARVSGAEEDAWNEDEQGDVNGIGTQHLPPLCPTPRGGLNVFIEEYRWQVKNSAGAWTLSTAGGGEFAMTANATNYCFLLVEFERRSFGNIYQWGVFETSVEVNTSGTSPASGESNTVDTSSSNQTAILFATIETDADKVTSIEYHPFVLHQNPECAMAITPLKDSDMTEITVVSDFRVDVTGKTFDVKTRTAKVRSPGSESGWTTKHTGGAC